MKMNRKGQAEASIGAVVAIITLVALVIAGLTISENMMGVTLDNYTLATTTSNYTTDFSASRVVNLTLTNVATDTDGSLSVAHDNHSNITNITVGGTSIGFLTNSVAVQSFTIPRALLGGSEIAVSFSVASPENMTDINLTYTQYSGCGAYFELCESASGTSDMANTSFTILPILAVLIVAAAVIGVLAVLGRP